MNKKGNFADIPEVLKVAFILGITILFVLTIYSQFNTQIQASPTPDTESKTVASNFDTASVWGFDAFFTLILTIFVIFSIIMARQIPSSPKYMIIAFFCLLIFPFGAMILANIWDGLDTGELATTMDRLKIMPFIMDNLVIFAILYTIVVSISLLTKSEEGIYAG